MNWLDCAGVEAVAGKLSGTFVIVGSRVPVQTVLDNFRAGVTEAEIADLFDVPLLAVKRVIEFSEDAHGTRHF